MTRPRLLDLFCGAGGAGMGYHRAGFDVVGIDIEPQDRYPFEFHQADALAVLAGDGPVDPAEFDAIHASPPCKAHTALAVIAKRDHPDLLTPTRAALLAHTTVPFVIENVVGAPMSNQITLCGTSFGLMTEDAEMWRHRWFEGHRFDWPVLLPQCAHRQRPKQIGVYGHGPSHPTRGRRGGWKGTAEVSRSLLGIDWMNRDEMSQAIPPAYTLWIGERLLAAVAARSAS